MDKVLISKLLPFVQNLILNNQTKYNFHQDAYLDNEEIGVLLNDLGEDDISKLMCTDTVEVSSKKNVNENDDMQELADVEEVPEEDHEKVEDKKTEEPSLEAEIQLIDDSKLGFTVEGTGAEWIMNKVLADLSLSSVGTPYAGAYKALIEEKEELEKNGKNTSDIDAQINTLKDAMRDYIRDNAQIVLEKMKEEINYTEFRYGENKSKVGYITQTFELKGNGGIKDRDSKDAEESEDTDNTENKDSEEKKDDNTNSTATKNRFDGGVIYGLTVKTQNSDIRFKGDFDSDNIDLSLSAETSKKTEQGKISAAMSLRETIDTGYHEGSGGASLDYSSDNKDLTTGAYGYYTYEKTEGQDIDWEADAAAYLKFKDNVRLEVCNEFYPFMNYTYAKLNLTGKKNFPENDIKLNGRFDAEYGAYTFKEPDVKPIHNLEFKARGSFVFNPDDDMLATLGAGVNYGLEINDNDAAQGGSKYYHDVTANVLGSFKKGKLGISALISLLYSSQNTAVVSQDSQPEPVKISSNVTMELSDIFVKGITPFVSYTLNTGITGLEHNIGGGIRLGIDDLSKKR